MSRKTSRSALTMTRLDGKTLNQTMKVQMNPSDVMDEINDLKIKTGQMDTETKQLRSKITRMKQILHDRTTQINKAITQTGEQQTIKTASESTIKQLRENINSLENTLESRENELRFLRDNDKLAISDELKLEVLEYCEENDRLQKQIAAVHEGEHVINYEISRVHQVIQNEGQYSRQIYDLQVQIRQLADKIKAYLNGEYRVIANTAIEKMSTNPDIYPQLREKLQEIIQDMQKQKEEEEETIRIILENDEKQKEYLRQILDDQMQKIQDAIAQQEQNQEEK